MAYGNMIKKGKEKKARQDYLTNVETDKLHPKVKEHLQEEQSVSLKKTAPKNKKKKKKTT